MLLCLVVTVYACSLFFFFKQKTAYEMRISDWSSDVCSSDLQSADQAAVERQGVCAAADVAVVAELRPPRDRWRRRRTVHRFSGPCAHRPEIGRASCRERVCQYV